MNETPVSEFYQNRSIFVTGSSGLMGKVLVEKLLYSCPGVKNIFMLIRPKRGKTPEQRLDDMWKLPMFQRLRESNPDAFKKMIPVQGDVTFDNLGISADILKRVIAETSIVFNCAATLKLEAKLKEAISMNTTGTSRTLAIAKQMKQLKAFVHLSTAFCYCDQEELFEKVYDTPHVPEDLIRCAQWMDEKTLDSITSNLIYPHFNTYTYSKRLAEILVNDQFSDMPVVIARPSIVTPAWEEPVNGWVDNLNGPVGLLVGAGKGVIRSMHGNGDYRATVIPLDYAINSLIVIAQKTATEQKPAKTPVYNLTASDERLLPWRQILEIGKQKAYEYPFGGAVWYPDGDLRSSKFIHTLCVIFFHIMPAYLIDFLMLIFGQKRFMVHIQSRISNGLDVLQYFTTREWKFNHKETDKLWDLLSPEDKKKFPFDSSLVDIEEYITRIILGARQYCMKEPLTTLPKARMQLKFLYILDRVTAVCFYTFLIWKILNWTGLISVVTELQHVVLPELIEAGVNVN